MKHATCHLYDVVFCMLRHYILLRQIWDRCLLLNVIILSKTVECLGNKLPVIVRPEHLDFVL